MPSVQLLLIIAILAIAIAVSGHVVLENPKPFKSVADGATNPISSTGADFPCKVPAGASYVVDGERTVYAVGETQEASFLGQAVHGGGSCQFALSADTEPTKESTWMVIHSIEGGCPARDQKGNLEGPNQDKYPFVIPDGIAPGEYTFAWTWQARVGGQPEYYMNCAPITVVGAKKKRERFVDRRVAKRADFPELFMANMGDVSGGCTTSEALNAQMPIKYPNAGASVDHPEGEDNLFVQPCDGNPRAGGGGGSGSSSVAAGPTTTSGPTTSSETQPPVNTPAPTPSSSCPVPEVSTVTVTVTATISTTVTASPAVSSAAPRPPGAPSAVPSSTPGTCTEGYLTCLPDETHFATCTGGQLTGPQPIAPGFKCRAGEGQGLDISPV